MKRLAVLAAVLVLCCQLGTCVAVSDTANSNLVNDLLDTVFSLQWRNSTNFSFPFVQAETKGLWPSFIHLNFVGKPDTTFIRRNVASQDSNAFVTLWTLQVLLETQEATNLSLTPYQDQIQEAVEAVVNFRDKNFPENEASYIFWPQVPTENGTWQAWPTNIEHFVKDGNSTLEAVEHWLKEVGLWSLWPTLQKDISTFLEQLQLSIHAFQIPADFDDTSLALALGTFLYSAQDQFPSAWQTWHKNNADINSTLGLYTLYSYCPFLPDPTPDKSLIDPRTYYFFREFLDAKYNASQEHSLSRDEELSMSDFCIIPTWVQNITRDREMVHQGSSMPFNVNNVDATVASNAIFGLTHLFLSNEYGSSEHFATRQLLSLYKTTVDYVVWVISSGKAFQRPDIGLVYYPSAYELYWFVSRTSAALKSSTSLPIPLLQEVEKNLTAVLKEVATPQLLNCSKMDQNSNWVYWDDFLGDGDEDWLGKPVENADDRLFSTALVINTMINVWTEKAAEHGVLQWSADTPASVKTTTAMAVSWLSHFILNEKSPYIPSNVFFSGSVKGPTTLPFSYPSNHLAYINDTELPLNSSASVISTDLSGGVLGYIPPEQYESMLASGLGHFNMTTPTSFPGFNVAEFPYWSAPVMTYATSLLALAKYSQL